MQGLSFIEFRFYYGIFICAWGIRFNLEIEFKYFVVNFCWNVSQHSTLVASWIFYKFFTILHLLRTLKAISREYEVVKINNFSTPKVNEALFSLLI